MQRKLTYQPRIQWDIVDPKGLQYQDHSKYTDYNPPIMDCVSDDCPPDGGPPEILIERENVTQNEANSLLITGGAKPLE